MQLIEIMREQIATDGAGAIVDYHLPDGRGNVNGKAVMGDTFTAS